MARVFLLEGVLQVVKISPVILHPGKCRHTTAKQNREYMGVICDDMHHSQHCRHTSDESLLALLWWQGSVITFKYFRNLLPSTVYQVSWLSGDRFLLREGFRGDLCEKTQQLPPLPTEPVFSHSKTDHQRCCDAPVITSLRKGKKLHRSSERQE